jgi:hypothetical protein
MSKDENDGSLEVLGDCLRGKIRIGWVIDGDEGALLGEELFTQRDLAKASGKEREHILATLTANTTEGCDYDGRAYFWETAKHAKAALRAIKAVLKSDPGGAWPEWAVKAKAAGWTSPKGWRP